MSTTINDYSSASVSHSRHQWIDGAKGISITLLVIWHTVGDRIFMNEALVFVRMPLFFFVSGLLAASALRKPLGQFLTTKVASLLYLFVVWSLIMFLLVDVPGGMRNGQIDWTRPIFIFVDPPNTLWFVYALAITFLIVRITLPINRIAVLAVSLALYIWSTSSGQWFSVSFHERVIRLIPFFIAGTMASQMLPYVVKRFHKFWLPAIALTLAACAALMLFNLTAWSLLTFTTGLLAIVSISLTTFHFEGTRGAGILAWLGGASLYIYVLHRIFLTYTQFGMNQLSITPSWLMLTILALLTTFGTAALGRWLASTQFAFLFNLSALQIPTRRTARSTPR